MSPNYQKIVSALFSIELDEKVEDTFDLTTDIEGLHTVLGRIGHIVYKDCNVPREVIDFIDGLYEYVEKNHVK